MTLPILSLARRSTRLRDTLLSLDWPLKSLVRCGSMRVKGSDWGSYNGQKIVVDVTNVYWFARNNGSVDLIGRAIPASGKSSVHLLLATSSITYMDWHHPTSDVLICTDK